MIRPPMLALAALLSGAGCFNPPPPEPVRPVGPNVVLAWTIERAFYDNGLARATEVITIRDVGVDGQVEVQDYGTVWRGDTRPRVPAVFRRKLTQPQMDQLQRAVSGLELPNIDRRKEAPGLVPWTMWGICIPVRSGTQCGQLLLEEWPEIGGAQELFALLDSFRRDARVHPEK
jgi:hypothetical protein